MRKSKSSQIALSVVALLLVAVTVVGVTYSWIDDVKQIEFNNDTLAKNGAPLKTGVDINSDIVINRTQNSINLGNVLKDYNMGDYLVNPDNSMDDSENYWNQYNDSDLVYQYTEDGEKKRHTKYDGASNASGAPVWNKTNNVDGINEKKGYFYESGGMHLSGCYSDGEHFYFPTYATDSANQSVLNGYREGNKDDENVNYISFTAKVSSPDANVDFWFENLPNIKMHGTNVSLDQYARYAIIVDGSTQVYSSSGVASGMTGASPGTLAGVRQTAKYMYYDPGNNLNTTQDRGYNSNTLFSIKKGNTVNLTIKIWLENGFASGSGANSASCDVSFSLVSSWAYSRRISIVDRTTGGAGQSWLNDPEEAPAKLYLTFPELLADRDRDPSHWTRTAFHDDGLFSELTRVEDTDNYYVDVPLVYNNEKMILYRCNNNGFNNDDGTVERSDYNVFCWNWWQTYTPNTYIDATYTLYGGSKDKTANGYFGEAEVPITNKGYGTWGDVVEISVYSHYNNTDFAEKGSGRALYIKDFSDEDTSGDTYIYEMYRADTNTNTPWKAYVPVSSSKIQFRYFGPDNLRRTFGYDSWNHENPQRRPLQSTGLYSVDATEYHFAADFNTSSDKTRGWGYWKAGTKDIDMLYLVKCGNILGDAQNAYDYMYDGNSTPNKNALWPGHEMTRLKDNGQSDVTWRDGSSPVMESDAGRTGTSTIYNHLIFNNGSSGTSHQTSILNVFPGCFYNPGDGKWYGVIEEEGRTATQTTTAATTAATEPTQPTEYPIITGLDGDGYYVYGDLLGDGTSRYIKFTNSNSETKFKIALSSSKTYSFQIVKVSGGNSTTYKSGDNNTKRLSNSGNEQNFDFHTFDSGELILTCNESGIFEFKILSENQDTIRVGFVPSS